MMNWTTTQSIFQHEPQFIAFQTFKVFQCFPKLKNYDYLNMGVSRKSNQRVGKIKSAESAL